MPPRVVMHTTALCPYCFLARRLLERHGIAYEERRLRRSERDRLVPLGGGLTFPQIEFGDRVIDGFTELRRLERSGRLQQLIAGPPSR
jgi:glutaredoxin 3